MYAKEQSNSKSNNKSYSEQNIIALTLITTMEEIEFSYHPNIAYINLI